ncbi:hypothetical protein RhiirA1_465952 [Rhizophagus irregularis]|uniref:DUF4218 domain-containing protein n=1 Tax=Rhizophagus irregularis TaxID=588596 RepID=A0A2N0REV8_9GLOM|nr:hypothetical protein RhiirA1_465952 [Rhizophagus irregularis]
MAGIASKFLKLTIAMLSPDGEERFLKFWKSFEYPHQWSKLPNPISHIESFMMSDCLQLVMVMPFILNRSLTTNCFKSLELAKLQERTELQRNQVVNAIVRCWSIVAKCSQLAFKPSLTSSDYEELEKTLKIELQFLTWMFPDFVSLPNLHACLHLLQHARTFGTLTNTAVGIKEMVHRIFKNMVPHTNRKNVELDLLKRYTTLQSIRHLVDGGLDPRFSRPSIDFIDMSRNSKRLFKDWFIIEDSLEEDNEEPEVNSQSSRIQNIKLKKPVSAHNTMIKTNTEIFQSDLALSYSSFGFHASLINKSCKFYEGASYMQNEGYFEVKCHLHKNDVVTIQNGHDSGYAIIKAIFKHKGNDDRYYPFIYIDWFEDTNRKHAKLDCPLFILWRNDNSRRKIFPLTVVDEIHKTFFIHDCNARCQDGNHGLDNNRYLKNEFFFKAV